MQISTQCSHCGKDYTAPATFAGRSVKCKQCGSVFTLPGGDDIDPPDLSDIEDPDNPKMMPTEEAFAKNLSRMDATGAQEYGLAGRSKESFRKTEPWPFPGSVEIEKFVPPALAIICSLFLVKLALSGDEPISGGIKFGRVAAMIVAFFGVFWPIGVIGVRKGLVNAKVVQPSEFWLKVLGAFSITAVSVLGLWVVGDGSLITLVFGAAIGLIFSLGLIYFVTRLQPKEIAPVLSHSLVGGIAAVVLAILVLWGMNGAAKVIARNFKKIDSVPASPIAYKMNWPKPAPVTVASNNQPAQSNPATSPTTRPTKDILSDVFMTARTEVPQLNFSYMILPQTPNGVAALVNDRVSPATIELWSTRPWKRITEPTKIYRQFKRTTYSISPDGLVLARLTDLPRFGLETVTPLGQPYRALVEFNNPELEHELVGLPSSTRAVVRVNNKDAKAKIKIVSLGEGVRNEEIQAGGLQPLVIEPVSQAIALLPNNAGVAVAGRDDTGAAAVVIHRFDPAQTQRLALSLNRRLKVAPVALTASPDNSQLALLIAGEGELLLFIWELPPASAESIFTTENLPKHEYIPGTEEMIRGNFMGDNPLLWLDQKTILLFGRLVIDVNSGLTLQTITEPNITSVIDWDGQTLSLLKNDSIVVTMKLNLNALRK